MQITAILDQWGGLASMPDLNGADNPLDDILRIAGQATQ